MSEAHSNSPENSQFVSDPESIPEITPLDPDALQAKKDALKTRKPSTSFFIRALVMILFILLFSGLIGGGYYVMQLHKQLQDKLSYLQSLTRKQDAQWQTNFDAYQNKIEQDNKNIENQIENQALQLQQLSDKHNWRLSEVIYLVSIAQERLNMGQEETTAIKILKTADDRLKSFSDVRVGPIRESIMKDIANLETSAQLDKMGIWIELGALRQQLSSLSFHTLQANIEGQPDIIETTQESHAPTKSAWRQALENTWKELKGLIRVREFNVDKLNSSLEPKDQIALLRAMDLIVIEAQWGVLQENTRIYKQSLDLLEDRLNVYFIRDELWKNMMAQINTLKTKNIERAKVDLSTTLSMLNNLEKASLRYHGELS